MCLWSSLVAALLGVLVNSLVLASTAPPHEYYVLSPEPLTGPLSVMSLEPGNTISIGPYSVILKQYESASIPATAFTSGSKLSGTGFFTVGSDANAADLLVPDDFAGTQFVVPHIAGNHRYFFLSPTGTANVTIQVGANSYNVTANQGVVNEFDAGSDNSLAGRITSDTPIVVTHVAYVSGVAQDAYPVPPAVNDVIGVRSQNTVLAALNSGTSVMVYASDGSSSSHSLSAGQQISLSLGSGATQGQGSALHIVANAPVAAVQYDDGDGTDATAFWQSGHFGRRHGLPVNAQYLAAACDQPSVTLTLYKGASAPEVQSCSGSSTTPGKAYFGANTSGANLSAGWYLISSSPVYAAYEAATPEDEHNLLGLTPVAGPTVPTLNSIASPTTTNPQSVSGTAGASQTVRLYVNGLLQATTTANGSGAYTFSAALIDGTNTLYATAVTGGNESDPSNAVSVTYNNTIPRSQSGSISGTVVWTPGIPATPYVITANLTVPAGAKLTLQPGTTLKFANGTVLTATGELKISGTAAAPVVLTSNAVTPARGSWSGVLINGSAGSVVEYATIEYTLTAVNVSGVPATVRNNTLRYFTNNGVYVSGAGASTTIVQGNYIDNLNDTGDCIETSGSSPTITGNTLTNCLKGVNLTGSANTTTISGVNIITGNDYGIYADGGGSTTPTPVVTGNQIYTNDNYSFYAVSYGSGGSALKINATGNWWGSTSPVTISGSIRDLTDDYTSAWPTVNYTNFLDGPNGSAVTGNYLIGKLTASTILTAGATYDIMGAVFVNSGVTLTIPAGTTIRFQIFTILIVDGTLLVQGASGNPVTITSGRPIQARGDWDGILFRAGTGSIVDYANINYAGTSINITSVAVTVRNSAIGNFSANGVYIANAGASGSLVQNNVIDNLDDTDDCVQAHASGPTISGNTLTNCANGINLTGGNNITIINGNTITGNNYGIYADGSGTANPTPTVTGNQIFGNDNYNFYTTAYGTSIYKINATGNWWGSTSIPTISASIRDLTDDYSSGGLPTVDYSNFLDGPNGSPVAANYLIGKFSTSTTLVAGATYDVIGATYVNSGVTLTIPAGTTLRFPIATLLVSDGTLLVQGTVSNPVTLTSSRSTPARGDWSGILIRAGTGSIVEYATIEWASTAVNMTNGSAIVRNNTLRNFTNNGVYISGTGASASLVQNNLIDNLNDTGDCIQANATAPTISGNTLTNCSVGIRLTGGGNTTTINGNNIITGNDYGVYGDGSGSANPTPTVTGNQLFSNDNYNFYTTSYGASTSKINVTGNWWGSTAIPTISGTIRDLTDDYDASSLPTVNYSGFLDGPSGVAVPGNQLIGKFTASTTLTAGTTYDVLGAVYVNSGVTLTIPAGVILRFPIYTLLVVDGTLLAQGNSGSPVTFTSSRPAKARGDWDSIYIRAGTGSIVEYAKIEYAAHGVYISAAPATIRNNTIQNFLSNGVYITGTGASGSLIQNNLIDNLDDTADCIQSNSGAPTIIGNTLTNCSVGVRLTGGSNTTTISGNNIISGNNYGVYSDGNFSYNPTPTVTGNQLFANDNSNFYTVNYSTTGSNTKINAIGNWWGSTSITTISATIHDLTDNYDSTGLPTVNFSNFLDGPNGSPVPGNHIIGKFTGTASLTTGAIYDVLGALYVGSGATLTIPSGVTLRFHMNTPFIADGVLNVQGTTVDPVVFTSAKAVPARGDWAGINLKANGSVVDHAVIEYGVTNIHIVGVTGAVRNSTVRHFTANGIYVAAGAGAAATVVEYNTIDNLDDTADCVQANGSAPTIRGNLITNCNKGINFTGGSNTTVVNGNNIVTSNNYGMFLDGASSYNPAPVVTSNQIFGNGIYNFYTTYYLNAGLIRNASNNWWGTTDPEAIHAGIRDQHDAYGSTLPIVDYSNFLDAPGGSPIANHLMGRLPTASTTLTANAVYDVLGILDIENGKTLTIPAGTTLKFHQAAARLVVNGTLSIQGSAGSKVRLTSGALDPARGDWYGIEITATATGVTIDHADIEWTTRAVSVTGTNATISNSLIHNFTDSGIRMTSATSASQILNNYIDNYDSTGYGIYLSASSPAITGNKIYRTSIGIFAIGASNPTITGNAISNNGRGIVLDGNSSNSATAVPNPVITGNDIFGNAGAQLEIYRYGATNPVVINATGNWWGTATPVAGQQILFTGGSPVSKANFSSPSAASQTGPVGGNVSLSEYYFSPNSDAIKDTTTISGTLNQSASWTITIRNPNYSAVRSFSGSGTTISAIWDGRDSGGNMLPDAIYSIQVEANGGSGSATIGARAATLDTTAPATAITAPTTSAVLSNVLQVPVLGSASDGYLVNFTLDYGAGAAPATWSTLTSQSVSVTASTLGTWVVSSAVGGATLGNGAYVLRLRTSDKAGNAGIAQIPITLDLLSISSVTQNLQLMTPLTGQQLQVNFSIPAPATAFLRIYPEAGGALVKEITQVFSSSGAKSLTWDGRNSSGAYVAEEAYSYALYIDDGVRNATYDPPAPGGDGSGSGTVDASYNANKNDFWKMNYTMNHYGRIRMQVSGCTSPTHFPYNWVPYPPGVHPLIWDGRGADGQIVSGTCAIYFDPPLYMKSNSVIVRGTTPKVTGTGASPSIEVKSNPYRITHSYEHISQITYRVDQDSYVTVKLLPPGVSDPASPQAIVITNNELTYAQSGGQPADHVVEWKGYEDMDTNDILVSEEGSYTFAIQATGVTTGRTALYRGALQLWQ